MKTHEILTFSVVCAIGVISLYTNYHQHLLIKDHRALTVSDVIVGSDEYIVRSVDSDEYVRGYHQATEDLGCPPDAESRNMAVESWRKINLQTLPKGAPTPEQIEKKQDEIAERIREAISPKPLEGK